MPEYNYVLVDVFTDRAFGGNQLAVFPDARGLTSGRMQAIAKELNLAETTFVLPPEDSANDFRVRIFTAEREMPMAGHPTIGTAFVLALQGLAGSKEVETTLRFEEQVGVIPVKIRFEGGSPVFSQMQQPLPEFGPIINEVGKVARMLSLPPEALNINLPLEVVSCGVPYLIVPLKDLEAVRNIKLRPDLFQEIQPSIKEGNVYVFTPQSETGQADLHSRMFWLEHGVLAEDAATGSASGPLGCYLARHKVFGETPLLEVINEQGFEMGRPSLIHIEIEQTSGQINAVRVGGQSHYMGKGLFELD
jgi:trans-2,3-dihydro-3-hydroxyanthranilate isomerase